MALFKLSKKVLTPIKEKRIDLEKTLQTTIEENLDETFGLEFVATELSLHNFRIDTLAFDNETQSFVIIEYKKDKSISIVDQGFSYLSLLLNNKADFVLEYNQETKKNTKKKDIDWSQTRIIFIANSFTTHQRNAINFRDLPIELFEVKLYEKDIISIDQIKPTNASESIKTVSKSELVSKVSREIKEYTVDDHFKLGQEKLKEIYDELRDRLLALDDRIIENPVKVYIGYKIGKSIVFSVRVYKSKLHLDIAGFLKKDLKDPEKRLFNIPESYEWGKVCYMKITKKEDLDYAMFLAKQAWEKFGK